MLPTHLTDAQINQAVLHSVGPIQEMAVKALLWVKCYSRCAGHSREPPSLMPSLHWLLKHLRLQHQFQCAGFFPPTPTSNSQTPVQCATIKSVLTPSACRQHQISQMRLSPTRLPSSPTLDTNHKSRVLPVILTEQLEDWRFPWPPSWM